MLQPCSKKLMSLIQ